MSTLLLTQATSHIFKAASLHAQVPSTAPSSSRQAKSSRQVPSTVALLEMHHVKYYIQPFSSDSICVLIWGNTSKVLCEVPVYSHFCTKSASADDNIENITIIFVAFEVGNLPVVQEELIYFFS